MNFHIHKRVVLIAIVVLAITIAVLGMAFVSTYKKVAPARVITAERISSIGRKRTVLGANDASSISSWMTFDYISHVFALPQEYLQSALNITDPRYPTLTLSRYAKDTTRDAGAVTSQVQNAVRDYFASTSSH